MKNTKMEGKFSKKVGIKKKMIVHFRKIFLLFLNLLFNHNFVFRVVGWFNKKKGFLKTIFVAYPASEEYANAYVYKRCRYKMRWCPWPAGIFKQNGKWGVMFVISSTDQDFKNPENKEKLAFFVKKFVRIKDMLRAEQMTSAGIIPGMLHRHKLISEAPEAEVTVKAVVKAEEEVRKILNWEEVPLVVLGGKGFIGSRLVEKLNNRVYSREVYSVDCEDGIDYINWPYSLEGKRAIIINITKKHALSNYLPLFWPDLVLINETYPEPSKQEIAALAKKGNKVYHVAGVEASSFPSFPKAYAGGIPACAAWNSPDMKVIVKDLSKEFF